MGPEESGEMASFNPDIRNRVLSAVLEESGGTTVVARKAECSTPTALKHLEALVEEGKIARWQGNLGTVYGKQETKGVPKPPDSLLLQGVFEGRRIRLRVHVLDVSKTNRKLKVESRTRGELSLEWNDEKHGWVQTDSGLIARPG